MNRVLFFLFALLTTGLMAATPPGLVNYQGVLRDASGAPLTGTYDMIFSFYDADVAGNQILVDTHDAANANPISVANGLFSVQLGSGQVTDGSGAGTYTTLNDVFKDFSLVWLSINVDGEALAPRIQVVAAAQALNADTVDGLHASDMAPTVHFHDSAYLSRTSDDSAAGKILLTKDPASTAIGNATLLINPATSDAGDVFFGIADNNTELFRLDKEGDADFAGRMAIGNSAVVSSANVVRVDHSEANAGITMGINVTENNSDASGAQPIIGVQALSRATGATNARPIYGVRGVAQSAGLSNGPKVGVEGVTGAGGLGLNYGLRGEALGSETNYGVYGESSGGTANWGLYTPNSTYIGENLVVGGASADDHDFIFFDNSIQFLGWDNTDTRFEFSNNLATLGAINVANLTSVNPYSSFGTATSSVSGDMTLAGDVFVSRDVEIGGELYLQNTIFMQASNSAGSDGNQNIYFYDDDSRTNEYLRWSNSLDMFLLSNDLRLNSAGSSVIIETTGDDELDLESNGNQMDFFTDPNNNETLLRSFRFLNDGTAIADKLVEFWDTGDILLAGSVFPNQSFDAAEGFWQSEIVQPGELVRVDPKRADGILRTTGSNDPGLLGVVSTLPAVYMGGGAFSEQQIEKNWGPEALSLFRAEKPDLKAHLLAHDFRIGKQQEALTNLTGLVLKESKAFLASTLEEQAITKFIENHVAPVALAGRVPVKVDGSNGPIRAGDLLAAGPNPGIAAKAVSSGLVIGTALEDWDEESETIMLFVNQGWYSPRGPGNLAEIKEVLEKEIVRLQASMPAPGTGVQVMDNHLQLVLDKSGSNQSRFSVFRDGANGLDEEIFRLDEDGNIYTKGSLRPAALDIAEYHPVSAPVEAGDVIAVDIQNPGQMKKANRAGDPAVVGIVSSAPGVLMGSGLDRIRQVDPRLAGQLEQARLRADDQAEQSIWLQLEERFQTTHAALALTGTVPCKVDATYGNIQPGDLLVASATPGHAMTSANPEPGTVIGKALEFHENGRGLIRVLVMNR